MLYTVDLKKITKIPHENDYDRWRRQLSDTDHKAVMAELEKAFDGEEVQVSSFIPGSDWTGTPYQPIWEACGRDDAMAGLFFGLLVWEHVMVRPDVWSFLKYDEGNVRGMTYFRITLPRPPGVIMPCWLRVPAGSELAKALDEALRQEKPMKLDGIRVVAKSPASSGEVEYDLTVDKAEVDPRI